MNSSDFASKKLKGRDVTAAPLINNYNKSLNAREEQNGRSMIEMLGVLAIIGVLSVGGIAGYSKAMMKYRINKTIEQITLIAGNIRSFFAPQGNYEGLDSYTSEGKKIIKKAKLVPDEMWEGNSIKNIFGNHVYLYEDYKNSFDDDHCLAFVIEYEIGDNLEVCIELLSYDWTPLGVKGLWLEMGQDNVSVKPPVDIDTAVNQCNIAIENTPNEYKSQNFPTIRFYFDIDINSSYWKGMF